jgi:hypothetical protein
VAATVGASVAATVGASVAATVGASVAASVGAGVGATHCSFAASHVSPAWQHSTTFAPAQHVVPSGQHAPAPFAARAAQHELPALQQKALLCAPLNSPQHDCEAAHGAADCCHTQQMSPPAFQMQCGVCVPAPQHVSVAPSQFTPVPASLPGQLKAGAGASVAATVGASVAATVGASVAATVGASVAATVGASVAASVGAAVATHCCRSTSHVSYDWQHSTTFAPAQQCVSSGQHAPAPFAARTAQQ